MSYHEKTAIKDIDLSRINVAIIGGTGGVGQALSRVMVTHGANLTVVGQTFRDSNLQNIKFIKADLSLMSEAKRIGELLCTEDFNIYIFTTGITAAPKRQETAEGLERDLAISYLSRLVILRILCTHLRKTISSEHKMKPRIFIMGYPGKNQKGNISDLNAEKSYAPWPVHMNTVAGNEISLFDCVKRYPAINFYGLNPGIIKTNIRNNLLGANTIKSYIIEKIIGLLTPSAETYAKLIVPLITSSDLEQQTGLIFDRRGRVLAPSKVLTDGYMQQFIAASEDLICRVIN